MSTQAFESWQVEHLRLTAFYDAETTDSTLEEWWTYLAPEGELQSITKNPKTRDVVVTGLLGDFVLEITKSFDRLHIVMRTNRDSLFELNEPEKALVMGEYKEISPIFFESIKRWHSISQIKDVTITRYAYGTDLLNPVDDVESGYKLMREMLPFISFEDHWSDFSLQFNDPKKFFMPNSVEMVFNYIKRYAVNKFHYIKKNADTKAEEDKFYFFCRKSYDNSTDLSNKDSLADQFDFIFEKITGVS